MKIKMLSDVRESFAEGGIAKTGEVYDAPDNRALCLIGEQRAVAVPPEPIAPPPEAAPEPEPAPAPEHTPTKKEAAAEAKEHAKEEAALAKEEAKHHHK